MKDETAESLVRLLTDVSGQLSIAQRHRQQLEERLTAVERLVLENNRMLKANYEIVQRLFGGGSR